MLMCMRIYVNADVTVVTWVAAIRLHVFFHGGVTVNADAYVTVILHAYVDVVGVDVGVSVYSSVDVNVNMCVYVDVHVDIDVTVDVHGDVDVDLSAGVCMNASVDAYIACLCACVW